PLLEERIETRPRLARRRCGCTVRRRPEVVAEVPRLLVRHSLCVRLAAVVVEAGLVERAVATAVKVRRAARADVAHADPLDLGDGAAAMTPNGDERHATVSSAARNARGSCRPAAAPCGR